MRQWMNPAEPARILSEIFDSFQHSHNSESELVKLFAQSQLNLLACIPWSADLIATRAIDLIKHLGASILNEGDVNRRIRGITFCARSLPKYGWNTSVPEAYSWFLLTALM